MGILGWLQNLTDKPLGGRVHVQWHEPYMLGLRMQNQTGIALGFLAAFVVAGWLITFMLISIDNNRPDIWVPLLSGLLVGFGVWSLLFYRQRSSSGIVYVREHAISRRKIGQSLTTLIIQDEKWPYEIIEQCQIIMGKDIGKSFSVLAIYHSEGLDLIGITGKSRIDKVVALLQANDVSVNRGRKLPINALGRKIGLRLPAIALAGMFVVAAIARSYAIDHIDADNQQAAQQEKQEAIRHDVADRKNRESFRETSQKAIENFKEQVARDFNTDDSSSTVHESPRPSNNERWWEEPKPIHSPNKQSSDQPSHRVARNVEHTPKVLPKKTPATMVFRRWTDATGEFQVDAKMMKYENGRVSLKKRDGKVVVVPFEQLSQKDQEYVEDTEGSSRPQKTTIDAAKTVEIAGGSEGWEFHKAGNKPLLGIQYELGGWGGEKTLGKIEPIFERNNSRHQKSCIARSGYAVGGLNVDAKRFVNAMQIVFMRLNGKGKLDPTDIYTSEWIGFQTGRSTVGVGGTGEMVVGIRGRHGAILDAVGLVYKGDE